MDSRLLVAAATIRGADALLIGAGAGMGVDSGLPDFRGNEGFWNAYPPLRKLNLSFVQVANPVWFRHDPEQAWGFYGHRLNLYRATAPHDGFCVLRQWGEAAPLGYFVFTSNVDGHFQCSGFDPDRILECHGSIHHLQCSIPCSDDVWDANGVKVQVDELTFRAREPLPRCRNCGAIARPNVLMFDDYDWVGHRSVAQTRRYEAWLEAIEGQPLAVVECGAGTAVPTVRYECQRRGGRLVRINPREAEVPPGQISLPLGTRAAVMRIDGLMQGFGNQTRESS